MAEICWPPLLGVGHDLVQILLDSIVVKALERLAVVETLVERVGDGGMLAEDVDLELVGPPIEVAGPSTAGVGLADGALS